MTGKTVTLSGKKLNRPATISIAMAASFGRDLGAP